MKEWIYNEPQFECDEFNYELLRYSPWSGHRNFIYDFICYFKPKIIAELGSYYGCSSFAIAQAIKDKKLNCVFNGIDTWKGDSFTQNDYSQNIYLAFKEIRDKCYSSSYLNMLRMTFDEASNLFDNNSIDLLHIDGSHNYEDVKHDFETWISKVEKNGIILFHDISSDKMFGEIMGSHYFWEEIKEKYKYTFEFDFSYGLGIIFLSKRKYDDFIKNVDTNVYQRLNNSFSVEYKDELRRNYFIINDDKSHIESLYKQISIKDDHLKSYEEDMQRKNGYISELENRISESEEVFKKYKYTVESKDKYISELESRISENEEAFKEYKYTVESKDKYILELESRISENEEVFRKYKYTVEGKDKYILELENRIDGNKKAFEEYEKDVKGKDNYILELENKIDEDKKVFEKYKQEVKGKDNYILELENRVDEDKKVFEKYEQEVKGKDNYILELENKVDEDKKVFEKYEQEVKGKDNYILELENRISENEEVFKKYKETIEGKDCYIEDLKTKLEKTIEYKIERMIKK